MATKKRYLADPINVRLSFTQKEILSQLALEQDLPEVELIRIAVREYLAKFRSSVNPNQTQQDDN